ncbi:TPA: hypothetical protein HA278_03800 [Candidatus Woesearchaeota archaeon]|jgi:hypothetical protein|nr:hypothetical protein [Candidatus Woesearchaeota archaeon]|tara:strand:- start:297 stop:677 length:381 start_codon:yes stop_codon:yes gene_type:complete
MEFESLNDETYVMYAMKHYTNPQCTSVEEFNDDLNRIKYLKRLFKKYINNGELKDRLIMNHIIIFYNVFGIEAATRLLFYRIEEEYHSMLKTFLVYLNFLPETNIVETDLVSILLDSHIINALRGI